MGLDGPFGEHIRLALQLSVLVDNCQRTEQVIGRIICIGQPICTVVDETVFGRKAIIEPVQFRLFLGNGCLLYTSPGLWRSTSVQLEQKSGRFLLLDV